MKFPYLVKHNGVYYPIGTDVPIEKSFGEGVTTPAVDFSGKVETETSVENVVEEPVAEVVEQPTVKDNPTPKYTDAELSVLSIQTLRKLAKENGLKVANKDTAEKLRKKLRAL